MQPCFSFMLPSRAPSLYFVTVHGCLAGGEAKRLVFVHGCWMARTLRLVVAVIYQCIVYIAQFVSLSSEQVWLLYAATPSKASQTPHHALSDSLGAQERHQLH